MDSSLDYDELVNWARNLLAAAREEKGAGRAISDDKLEALRFLRLATTIQNCAKMKSAEGLEVTSCLKWIRGRAKKRDELGYLCDDFLNCYGLKK